MKRWYRVLCLALIVGGWISGVAAAAPTELPLEAAIRLGLEASPAMHRAQLRRDVAAIELRRAEVNVRATVTPIELDQAKRAYERAEHEVQLERTRTALEIERLYYDVLRAADTLTLREHAVERASQQLDIALRQHASGQITELQLREVDQRLSLAELAAREAAHRLQMAEMALRQATGLHDQEWVLTDEVAIDREPVDVDEGLREAEQRRLEVFFAERAVADAKRAVELADNDYTPRVELERARIALAEAELAYAETIDQVRLEVWDRALALTEAEGQYELALGKLDLASDQLDLAELRYHNGLNTILDVLNAQSEFAAAEVEAVAAHYDYNMAWAAYLQAIGRGFDRWPELNDAGTAEPAGEVAGEMSADEVAAGGD